mgnify:CR=1 FL=1
MATVSTTTNGNALRYPGSTYVDVQPNLPPNGVPTNYIFVLVLSSTANTFEFFRSTDGGASFGLFTSIVRTNVAEAGPIHIDKNGTVIGSFDPPQGHGMDVDSQGFVYIGSDTVRKYDPKTSKMLMEIMRAEPQPGGGGGGDAAPAQRQPDPLSG